MSTKDVPGANPANADVLAMGAWAEHPDGSLIVVESVEMGSVIYSIFDVAQDPVVEYRDAMREDEFEDAFSWDPDGDLDDDVVPNIKWTWHDKTPFPWDRVMQVVSSGVRHASAASQLNAAQRVAESLDLRADRVRDRQNILPTLQKAATDIMHGLQKAIKTLDE